MEEKLENAKTEILKYFAGVGTDYWKTVEQISTATRISSVDVLNILTSSGDFVRSSYRQKAGEPLYTTRELFRNKAPFVDKMIGAFKNRID